MAHEASSALSRPDGVGVRARLFAATLGVWLLVVAAAALALRVADEVPRMLLGVPRGVRKVAGVAELERLAARPMPLPSYYPDTIDWPPAEGRYELLGSAALWCRLRAARVPALIIATAPAGSDQVSPDVLPRAVDLQREAGFLGSRPAAIARLRGADGVIWQQVEWRGRRQIVLVRYRGTLDELMRIAGSVHE